MVPLFAFHRSNPPAKVEWFHNGKPLSRYFYERNGKWASSWIFFSGPLKVWSAVFYHPWSLAQYFEGQWHRRWHLCREGRKRDRSVPNGVQTRTHRLPSAPNCRHHHGKVHFRSREGHSVSMQNTRLPTAHGAMVQDQLLAWPLKRSPYRRRWASRNSYGFRGQRQICQQLSDTQRDKWRQRELQVRSQIGVYEAGVRSWRNQYTVRSRTIVHWQTFLQALRQSRWAQVLRQRLLRPILLHIMHTSRPDARRSWWGIA